MSEKTYEQNVTELEGIVQKLESGNAPLGEMVELYEQGMKLYKLCSERLSQYERRLDIIKENDDA
ncbi:MAG: exodeoxyribonuclease VII small subunit [Eubacteriales bacterium]|nr:exodeoxyribonuclease VII small subunit [Eubacteriales bacterium]